MILIAAFKRLCRDTRRMCWCHRDDDAGEEVRSEKAFPLSGWRLTQGYTTRQQSSHSHLIRRHQHRSLCNHSCSYQQKKYKQHIQNKNDKTVTPGTGMKCNIKCTGKTLFEKASFNYTFWLIQLWSVNWIEIRPLVFDISICGSGNVVLIEENGVMGSPKSLGSIKGHHYCSTLSCYVWL